MSKDDAVGILRFLNGTGESADIDPTVFAREEEDYGALAPQSALSEDERYTLPTLDYTLPVHMRGGVDVDAFEDEPGIAGGDGEGGVCGVHERDRSEAGQALMPARCCRTYRHTVRGRRERTIDNGM